MMDVGRDREDWVGVWENKAERKDRDAKKRREALRLDRDGKARAAVEDKAACR